MKSLTALGVIAALALATHAAADPFKPGKGDQLKLGRRVADEIRQKEKVLPERDPRVRYIQRIGQKLLAAIPPSKDEPWEYTFDVIESKEINAFALPGGPIFLYTELIDIMDSEDEIAAVMAHEIVHVRREHWAYSYRDQQKRDLLLVGASLLLGMNRTASQLAGIGADVLVSLPYSRRHEHEADDYGLQILIDAGYDPRAMVRVLEKLGESNRGAPPEILSTHPDARNRAARVKTAVDGMNRTFPDPKPIPPGIRSSAR